MRYAIIVTLFIFIGSATAGAAGASAIVEYCPECGTYMKYYDRIDYGVFKCPKCDVAYEDFERMGVVGDKYESEEEISDIFMKANYPACPDCEDYLRKYEHSYGVPDYTWYHYKCIGCGHKYLGDPKKVGDEFILLFAEEVNDEAINEKHTSIKHEVEAILRADRIDELKGKSFSQSQINRIMEGKIKIGDSKTLVLESWGRPNDINRTTTAYGTSEQWVYGLGTYVYFDNGVVTTIQN